MQSIPFSEPNPTHPDGRYYPPPAPENLFGFVIGRIEQVNVPNITVGSICLQVKKEGHVSVVYERLEDHVVERN